MKLFFASVTLLVALFLQLQNAFAGSGSFLGKSTYRFTGDKLSMRFRHDADTVVPDPSILKSYSKFDFVSGEKIIYDENFMTDEAGELPAGWNTGGKGELVTLSTVQGRWLRLYQNATYLSSNKPAFTKNFTIEFDMVLDLKTSSYSYPYVSFGFLSTKDQPANSNKFVQDYELYSSVECKIAPSLHGNTVMSVESALERNSYFQSESQDLAALESFYGKKTHVSIQVQGQRTRIWINGEKKFDLPMAAPSEYIFNNIFFRIYTSSYTDDQIAFYVGNIRIAAGKADNRNRFTSEGKFSTTGILFEPNSASIKPESFGALQEIAKILRERPGVRILITGHTSNDGDDKSNLDLSKRRALAVLNALVTEFGIPVSTLSTDGKGSSVPVADNKNSAGRAANRRVEFSKNPG